MVQDDQSALPANQVSDDSFETRQMEEPPSPTFQNSPDDSYVSQPSVLQQTQVVSQPLSTLAWLAALSGIRQGRLFPLDPRGTAIGRDAQNDVVLDDTIVSRQHAKIRFEPGARKSEQFVLYDLGSANGTFVNDRKIVRQVLNDDDRVRIGETVLVFKMVGLEASAKKAKRTKRTTRAKRKK